MIGRRSLVLAGLAAPLWVSGSAHSATARSSLHDRMADLERASGGRLGVAALDLKTGVRFGYRAAERFPMCSTFKASLAAHVLRRVDEGRERLDRVVPYRREDLVAYSPVTESHVGAGLSVGALCEAAVTRSDNTAANLLLQASGGPAALTAFFRNLGDAVSRLDRHETELNTAIPGDVRDTTTPAAMLETLRELTLGGALRPASRTQLCDWLIACQTGAARLKAGLPDNWRVGDKTGTGEHGTSNDIAVAWPPGRAPIVVTSYLTGSPMPSGDRDGILASAARLVAGAGFGG